ncbi:glycosyltransferase [Candidatus Woesearchaeota archaeon]|nr:glycosyltransferase [Candidatus Woesearchaeota archaeon]
MIHLQTLRSSFPDLQFFGNTFIAMYLAANIPQGTLVSRKVGGSLPELHWQAVMQENLGVRLVYHDYLGNSTNGQGLAALVRQEADRGENPVVVNYHFPDNDLEERVIAKKNDAGSDVRQFVHLHCSAEFFFQNRKTQEQRQVNLRRAYDERWVDKFIAVSYAVRDSYLSVLPHDAMEVVRNGVPEEVYEFRPERDKDAFKNQVQLQGKFLVGYSGRLDTVKGYQDLIAILSWFNKHPEYDVGFLIASSGGAKLPQFEGDVASRAPRLLRENRLGMVLDVAKFVGGKKHYNTTVYDFFTQFVETSLRPQCRLYKCVSPAPLQAMVDVYIQPSESEGLPLAVIEAAFTGVPIVAYRVGGIPEIVSDANGKCVDYHPKQRVRVNEFCDAIVAGIEQNYRRDGLHDSTNFRMELRNRLVPIFGANAMTTNINRVYRDAIR